MVTLEATWRKHISLRQHIIIRQDEARRHAVQYILIGVCWLHTTKSACEARLEASEAVLAGVVWLHPGEQAEIRAKKPENGARERKNQQIRAEIPAIGADLFAEPLPFAVSPR